MNTFVVMWVLAYCQSPYPVEQRGPKCAGFEKDRFVRTSDIREMSPFRYLQCNSRTDTQDPKTREYEFFGCRVPGVGCEVTLSNGTVLRTLQYCGAWKKVTL